MTRDALTSKDYPLAEKRPDLVQGRRGKSLEAVTLAALKSGEVEMEDLRITSEALEMQADIARAEGRAKLAGNFDRASELVDIPQEYLMEIYELLRPGRAPVKAALLDVAQDLRTTYNATRMAEFLEEAAEVYADRGLFNSRY